MIVSVIITTKNEQKNIANCLRSIKNSMNPINSKVEIIVVDNNSSDNTVKIARRFTDKVYDKGPERSAQRNFGVEQSKGKYILYLDADMILWENVISECVEKSQKEDIVALYIPERIVDYVKSLPYEMPKAVSWGIKVRDFERSFYNATCIDAVRFIRRDKFLEIAGFDENLTGPEDWDFDRRIKTIGKVSIIDLPIYHNEGKLDFWRYTNKKAYYAHSFHKYIQKWGRNDPIIKKQLGLWYRFFEVFMENGKWRKLFHAPWLTLGMYFLKFMVGIGFLGKHTLVSRI